jgi:hypothetical protein
MCAMVVDATKPENYSAHIRPNPNSDPSSNSNPDSNPNFDPNPYSNPNFDSNSTSEYIVDNRHVSVENNTNPNPNPNANVDVMVVDEEVNDSKDMNELEHLDSTAIDRDEPLKCQQGWRHISSLTRVMPVRASVRDRVSSGASGGAGGRVRV